MAASRACGAALCRRARSSVSEVVSTLLMVAVTLILVAVLYLMLAGPTSPPVQNSTLLFGIGEMSQNATNHSRNDTFYTVQSKLGSGDILWNEPSLQMYILDMNGTLLLAHNTTFDDINHNGKADGGDRIYVRGMTAVYHGLRLSVNYQGRIVGDVPLP